MRSETDFKEIRDLSIREFLISRGIPRNREGAGRVYFKSPFCRDTNFSLCVYMDTNSFYDWSQGFGGSIIDLVMAMDGLTFSDTITYLEGGKFTKYQANYKQSKPVVQKYFEYTRYLTANKDYIKVIKEYAESRCLYNGYEYGVFPTLVNEEWVDNPSVMYLHRDENNAICGAKFRRVYDTTPSDKDNSPRFSARGRMAFYILENISPDNFGEPTLYVVEGEGNANSLWQYCKDTKRNCVVISFGGVGNLPDHLPNKYLRIKDKKLIIDFDGNQELYEKRIRLYKPYGLVPIKMVLDKGVDINYLYINKKMGLIDKLL